MLPTDRSGVGGRDPALLPHFPHIRQALYGPEFMPGCAHEHYRVPSRVQRDVFAGNASIMMWTAQRRSWLRSPSVCRRCSPRAGRMTLWRAAMPMGSSPSFAATTGRSLKPISQQKRSTTPSSMPSGARSRAKRSKRRTKKKTGGSLRPPITSMASRPNTTARRCRKRWRRPGVRICPRMKPRNVR